MRPVLLFLLLIPLSLSFKYQNKQNIVDFSVKLFDKNSTLNSISVLNKEWEPITKYVNFKGNSLKLAGRMRFPTSLDKIVFKFGDEKIEQNEVLVTLGNQNLSHTTIHTDSYKMKVFSSRQSVQREFVLQTSESNGCECSHGNCACCIGISVPEFRHSVCVNATYNPATIGLDLSIGVDGHYFSEEISLRNPPPICFSLPIPGAEHVAGVCVAFTKLDLDRKAKILTGCMDFEVELVHLRVLTFHLGCFRMPI